MPEDDCFIAGLTGIETVHFMAKLSGLPSREGLRRAHEILDFSDIGQERYRAVETYSTGMRQKLKFAQTLVHDPELLIFDEPTTGLDPGQRAAMLRRIGTLARKHGKSILLSTHILHDVKETCDWVVILSEGQLRVMDSLAKLSVPTQPGMWFRVLESPDALIGQLRSDGFEVQEQPDGSLWISGVTRENCQAIWRAASTVNVPISSLEPASNSLEQIFFDSVRESSHAAT
jgi:ABC-2 type transport system ATP-binding protein